MGHNLLGLRVCPYQLPPIPGHVLAVAENVAYTPTSIPCSRRYVVALIEGVYAGVGVNDG